MKIIAFILFIATAGFAQEIIPQITIAGQNFSNATLTVLNSSNATIRSGVIGKKINLADLPEPWRSKYYDEKKVEREREELRAAAIKSNEVRAAKAQAESERKEAARKAAEQPKISNEWIELTEEKGRRTDREITITGKLVNKSGKRTLKTLIVTYGIFDAQGNKLGSASDILSTLDPGESWKFEATSFNKNASTYRLDRITCSDGRLD